jgi:hypothetical protein
MKTLFFGLVLSFVLIGCDEVHQGTQDTCLAIVDACLDVLVPEADELYCLEVVTGTSDEDERRRQCDAFHRGQLCQCITPVCYSFIVDELMIEDADLVMDVYLEILPLQCPRLSLTP